MIEVYKTVKQEGLKEIEIRRSRFIGHVKPVRTEEEAEAFIEHIKKQHRQATHNCSAYVIGDRNEIQKQSDDGEPSGTAGKPILEVMKQQEIKYTAIVVTRYFGGIKLGAGGLIRAYTDGAVAALEAGIPIYRVLHQPLQIVFDYTWQGKLENEWRNRGVIMDTPQFTDKVSVTVYPVLSDADQFANWVTDLTNGQADITKLAPLYLEHEENILELN